MSRNDQLLQDDESKSRPVALDYIGAVLEADTARMERCLHGDLMKRAYLPGIDQGSAGCSVKFSDVEDLWIVIHTANDGALEVSVEPHRT